MPKSSVTLTAESVNRIIKKLNQSRTFIGFIAHTTEKRGDVIENEMIHSAMSLLGELVDDISLTLRHSNYSKHHK
ncbi:hypothetical protein PT276_02675 [Orbaceae bacterium ESL0721]|nr:hypothetical protein [Orbaceae bacterium ESL0721]